MPSSGPEPGPAAVPSRATANPLKRSEPTRSYEAVAGVYDGIARIWSCGRIDRAKCWPMRTIAPGDRCLFAGVGTGLDALHAARRGAQVTALDVSASMLEATRRRLSAEGFEVELICEDLFDHEREAGYDVVVASFVLNVMGPECMREALSRLAGLTAASGRLMLADFAPASGGFFGRAIAQASWLPVGTLGRWLGLASGHALYDYEPVLRQLGFGVHKRRGFSLWRGGPDLYVASVTRRASACEPGL